MPTFSVIIPTHNRLPLLEETLDSVWGQTFTDYEVIVVDNGSSDGTLDFLRGLEERVQLIAQANLGAGAGRNVGARHARGEYLAFLDSDDLWFPWTLACFAELIRQCDRPAIVAGKVLDFCDESELDVVRETPLQMHRFTDYFTSHASNYFVGAGMSVLRRDEFLKTSGYTDQPINSEDHDLVLRLGNARGFVQITLPITLGWRRHKGGATSNMSRSVAGNLYLIDQEYRGVYPGGDARRSARRKIITRHVRPTALACLRAGRPRDAWALYRATFAWHIHLGRLRFLAAFPLLATISHFRSSLDES
jgi:glycosyltransferase involved in cell wall biosynthesis